MTINAFFLLFFLVALSAICLFLLIDLLLNIITVLIFRGAFFTKTSDKRLRALVSVLRLGPTSKVIDLGSGKGEVVLAVAKTGAKVTGIEVNPWFVFISRFRLRRHGYAKHAKILHANFWPHDLAQYNVVIVYGIGYMMKHLKLKLERELKPGTKVASVYFPIPGWKTTTIENDVRLYIVPNKR